MTQKPILSRHRQGFTLIEILVVVAIIALLLSILLPGLNKAREQGKAVVCGSNMSQIFKGILMYTTESRDVLPHLGYRWRFDIPWWPTQIAKSIGNQFELLKCPSDEHAESFQVFWNRGRPYMDRQPNPDHRPLVSIDLSYWGSCEALTQTTWTVNGQPSKGDWPRKITDYKFPDQNILLVEGKDENASEICMRYERMVESIMTVTRGSSRDKEIFDSWRRHNGRGNYLFADGHVDRLKPEYAAYVLSVKQQFGAENRSEIPPNF